MGAEYLKNLKCQVKGAGAAEDTEIGLLHGAEQLRGEAWLTGGKDTKSLNRVHFERLQDWAESGITVLHC